ncbi:hypothetical protein BO70DRAFT_401700, partial [Aspergillus heteromorphus CBS 117.55]
SSSPLPQGVNVARVDYTDPTNISTLIDTLRTQQALIITMSHQAPPTTILHLIRAAAQARVPYVQPSWWGHDPSHESVWRDSNLSTRRDKVLSEIQFLGVSHYLLLVCNFWYEWSLGGGPNRFGFDFPRRKVTFFDGGLEPINTTTWPQVGRALARLLSLKELPQDESDPAPTLSKFRDGAVYVSSFRLTQREMFESVKRVTKTQDQDWTVMEESAVERYEQAQKNLQVKLDLNVYTKMLYSRIFFKDGGGDYESTRGLDNIKWNEGLA